MADERKQALQFLREVFVGPGRVDEEWLGVEVRDDGQEAVIVFLRGNDPTHYAIRVDLDDPHAWWRDEARFTIYEHLDTGLLERATRRTVSGRVELDLSDHDRDRYIRLHPAGEADGRGTSQGTGTV